MQLSLKSCKHCGLEYQDENGDFCCHACSVIYTFLSQSHYVTSDAVQPSQIDLDAIAHYADHNKIKIYIDGIHCISCLKFVEGLPEKIQHIKSAQYILSESTIYVEFTNIEGVYYLTRLLNKIGYDYKLLKPDHNLSDIQKEELHNLLVGIGVSAFSAGNIMLLAISIYAGLDGSIKHWFNWVSFFLFLPIILYSAIPFYQGALRAIKLRQISIDLPITIALLFGFIFSTYNLIKNIDSLYYDSLSSFIFLILLTRYLNKKMIFSNSYIPSAQDLLPEKQYFVTRGTQEVQLLTSQISPGDIIKIDQNKRVPVDGVLISERAEFNTSFITGETFAKEYKTNMNIFAGFESLDSNIYVKATASLTTSSLYKSFDKIKSSLYQKTQLSLLVDRISQTLLICVFLIGLMTFMVMPNSDGAQRFLALMIVACPCALAFGAPLALYKGVKNCLNSGIIIRNASVFEKYSRHLPIYFDKTGTLTKANLKLKLIDPQSISSEHIAVLLGLENISQHPIAQAVRNHFKDNKPVTVTHAQEIKSLGVVGLYQHDQYQFVQNKNKNQDGAIVCDLIKNNQLIHSLHFKDELSLGAKQVMDQLKDQLTILSGDTIDNLKYFAQENGLKHTQCLGGLKPEQKADIVKAHKSIFVGDGVNDTLALASSEIGIAVRGAFDISLNACDIYFQNQNLTSILDFFAIAESTYKTIKRNIIISLAYNIISGTAAVLGMINPLVAAVLMPISSLAILFSTTFSQTIKNNNPKKEVIL